MSISINFWTSFCCFIAVWLVGCLCIWHSKSITGCLFHWYSKSFSLLCWFIWVSRNNEVKKLLKVSGRLFFSWSYTNWQLEIIMFLSLLILDSFYIQVDIDSCGSLFRFTSIICNGQCIGLVFVCCNISTVWLCFVPIIGNHTGWESKRA